MADLNQRFTHKLYSYTGDLTASLLQNISLIPHPQASFLIKATKATVIVDSSSLRTFSLIGKKNFRLYLGKHYNNPHQGLIIIKHNYSDHELLVILKISRG